MYVYMYMHDICIYIYIHTHTYIHNTTPRLGAQVATLLPRSPRQAAKSPRQAGSVNIVK